MEPNTELVRLTGMRREPLDDLLEEQLLRWTERWARDVQPEPELDAQIGAALKAAPPPRPIEPDTLNRCNTR